MFLLNAVQDFFSRLTPANYVDIACAGLVLLFVVIGFVRGISGELSRLLSLAAGAAVGYWIYVPGVETLSSLEYLRKSPQFTSLIAFCVALLGGLILFLLLNLMLGRIIKIVLDPAWDRSLGMLAGVINAAILLALVFTLAMILPQPSHRELLCRESRIGRMATPLLERMLGSAGMPEKETDKTAPPPAARPAQQPVKPGKPDKPPAQPPKNTRPQPPRPAPPAPARPARP